MLPKGTRLETISMLDIDEFVKAVNRFIEECEMNNKEILSIYFKESKTEEGPITTAYILVCQKRRN